MFSLLMKLTGLQGGDRRDGELQRFQNMKIRAGEQPDNENRSDVISRVRSQRLPAADVSLIKKEERSASPWSVAADPSMRGFDRRKGF